MHLNRRFAIVVGSSLLWAFLVTALFYRLAAGGAHTGIAHGKALVVAAQSLPLGAVVAPDSVKTIQVPENLFPKGAFSTPEEVLQRPVVSPIEADEPIVEARIGAKGSGVGLSPMIPPGLRAASVRVNDVVGVAGFVLPGMRVDVLVTGRPPGREDTMTNTVLQNILVLSAGTTIQTDAKGQPISAAVVTLLVSPPQAEALTLANSEGHIQLVLRNSTDQQVAPTGGWQLRALYGLAAPPEVRPAAPPPEAARPRKPAAERPQPVRPEPVANPVAQHPDEVIMIRGNQKTIEAAPPKMAN
ncbi:SAF domain [Candidatus Sulfopaludibacter sp. SbA4]|nr:SAF domain [Candidatus Sulfopaludibacter sp. SbA4]